MDPYHPVFAVALTVLAFRSVRITFAFVKKAPPALRFGTIDGLRGYLAFFVMMHHAVIWHIFLKTGTWATPTSYFYSQLGQVSVLLFFMITSFLFYDKLMNSRGAAFNWRGFFIGRLFRMAPLYLAVMLPLFLIVAGLSHWRLHDRPESVLVSLLSWLLFSIPGLPPINGVDDTPLVVAGVTWSLRYEWCFYLVLPLVSLTTGQRPGWPLLAVSAAGLVIGWATHLNVQYAAVFVGGMLAAHLIRAARFVRFCTTPAASVVVLICLGVILRYPSARQVIPCLMLVVLFCLIAGGASLFGLFNLQTSRRFGEIAYGIYLIHGIVLFSAVNFIIGRATAAAMSTTAYWTMVALCVPVVLALSGLAYHYIEHPGIRSGKRLGKRFMLLPVVKAA